MIFRYISLAVVAAIFCITQAPSMAQSCADAIKIPYRAPSCNGQSAERAKRISPSEAASNAISMPYFVHSKAPEFGHIQIRVVVSPTGKVVGVTPFSGDAEWYEQATALAMTWRFKPSLSQGSAIYATFSSVLDVVPPERRPETHKPFADIKDWNSVRITLQRTACRGSCPAYKLTVFGDGSVQYQGDNEWVDYSGKEYRGHVSQAVVRQLVELFRSADYFNLFDRYGRAHDGSDYITSISFDDNSKSVVDESGYHDGIPDIVRTLEDEIDRLAGPSTWPERQKLTRNKIGD